MFGTRAAGFGGRGTPGVTVSSTADVVEVGDSEDESERTNTPPYAPGAAGHTPPFAVGGTCACACGCGSQLRARRRRMKPLSTCCCRLARWVCGPQEPCHRPVCCGGARRVLCSAEAAPRDLGSQRRVVMSVAGSQPRTTHALKRWPPRSVSPPHKQEKMSTLGHALCVVVSPLSVWGRGVLAGRRPASPQPDGFVEFWEEPRCTRVPAQTRTLLRPWVVRGHGCPPPAAPTCCCIRLHEGGGHCANNAEVPYLQLLHGTHDRVEGCSVRGSCHGGGGSWATGGSMHGVVALCECVSLERRPPTFSPTSDHHALPRISNSLPSHARTGTLLALEGDRGGGERSTRTGTSAARHFFTVAWEATAAMRAAISSALPR